jgi:crossover junction endodeoxyribonuclease RuvC
LTAGPRVILGIDPGIALLGYGVLTLSGAIAHVEHGAIATPSSATTPCRLQAIYGALSALKRRYAVTDVAMEMLYYSRHVTTAVAVGQARGVAILATVDRDTTFGEYTATEIKQAVAGDGRAKKRQMQEMVQLILGLPAPPYPDDAADALATAICHAHRVEFADVLGRGVREVPR